MNAGITINPTLKAFLTKGKMSLLWPFKNKKMSRRRKETTIHIFYCANGFLQKRQFFEQENDLHKKQKTIFSKCL